MGDKMGRGEGIQPCTQQTYGQVASSPDGAEKGSQDWREGAGSRKLKQKAWWPRAGRNLQLETEPKKSWRWDDLKMRPYKVGTKRWTKGRKLLSSCD